MKKLLIVLALLGAAYGAYEQRGQLAPTPSVGAHVETGTNALIVDAFRNRRSNIQVHGNGNVVKVLADDRDGSPHQRFIVRVAPEQTVLIAHNIALAPRVAGLQAGDSLEFSGEYEWNERGGVVHWTHLDPQGRHDAGWIRFGGTVYQ